MFDATNWTFPILIGLASVAAIWFHARQDRSFPDPDGVYHEVTYSWQIKAITAALVPVNFIVLYEAAQALVSSQWLPALAAAAMVTSITVFHVYQVFFVRFGYDRDAVYFDSPLSREKTVSWDNLRELGSSIIVQSDYLDFEGIGRIWCFEFSNGYKDLDGFLQLKTGELLKTQN